VITLVVLGSAGAIAYQAWDSTSGAARATLIFLLATVCLIILLQAWWFFVGKRSAIQKATDDATGELNKVHQEILSTERQKAQEELASQQLLTIQRDVEIRALKRITEWVHTLIDRERSGSVNVEQSVYLWGINLRDREPYFEFAVFLDYRGALELVIGERASGRLSWDGKPFSSEPTIKMGGKEPPFRMQGPAKTCLIVRQHVSSASAAEIQTYLDGDVAEIELESRDFRVSLSKAFNGEALEGSTGWLFGDYIGAKHEKKSFKPPWWPTTLMQ
jgi:hypothetical protein